MVPAKTPNSSGVATAFILRTTRVVEARPEPPDYSAYPEAHGGRALHHIQSIFLWCNGRVITT